MRIKKKMLKVGAQKTRREIEIYKKKRNLHSKARITYILEKMDITKVTYITGQSE
jgi:hypothetical protein